GRHERTRNQARDRYRSRKHGRPRDEERRARRLAEAHDGPPRERRRGVAEEQAGKLSREVGCPLVVRPSYVLGGRAMEIVFNEDDRRTYMNTAVSVSNDSPVLRDRFLDVAPNPFKGGIAFVAGRAKLPDAPGLGVDVDWDILAKHQRAHSA
ncbi:hypothetical protein B4Q13_17370, partial [Lacticaseibacillus rhamnosus]